jgi:hypothetical protein
MVSWPVIGVKVKYERSVVGQRPLITSLVDSVDSDGRGSFRVELFGGPFSVVESLRALGGRFSGLGGSFNGVVGWSSAWRRE